MSNHATDKKALRLDVLIRTSQRKKEAKSPQQQLDLCESCAEINGYEITAVHDSGGSESGKTMARQTIENALARIQAGKTDGVIVAWLDRLGRAPIEEAMTVFRQITTAGGVLVPADGGGKPIEPDDPQGETNLVIQLQIARQYWAQTAKRFNMSREGAIREGKAMGCPFGYRYKDATPRAGWKGVMDSRLVPHETDAPVVAELFERKTAGATWLELSRWLDQAAPKPDGRHWARSTVIQTIRCRTHLGELRHGEYLHVGAHGAIVSPTLWRQAQNPPGRRTPRGTYLLSGLVRCAGCGRSMRGSSGGSRSNGRGRKPPVYVCTTVGCEFRYTTAVVDNVDAEVVEQFFARLDTFHARFVAGDELVQARAAVSSLEDELTTLVQLKVTHPKALAAHQAAVSDLESRLQDAEDHLAELLTADGQRGLDARELRADWPNLALDERREILRAGIDAVLVRRALKQGAGSVMTDRILVLFKGDGPVDLLARRAAVRGWTWTDEPGSLGLAA
jgi:DNA invertase Pin-like site-specific DNA recombinase